MIRSRVRIGGTDTLAPNDFGTVNDVGVNLSMKLGGFPPFVVYLSYVGTPEGVITATRGRAAMLASNGPWTYCCGRTDRTPPDRRRSDGGIDEEL